MHKATTIAKRFIELAKKDGRVLSCGQIASLVYIAHGFSLAIFRTPLVKERFETWTAGPAIPALHRKIGSFPSKPIPSIRTLFGDKPIEEVKNELIAAIYDEYSWRLAYHLMLLCKEEGTPWDDSDKAEREYVSNASIEYYFLQLVAGNDKKIEAELKSQLCEYMDYI